MSESTAAPVVEYATSESGIAVLTLNRPEVRNAINRQMRADLIRLVRQADSDPSVRTIVLGGAGEKAFCAGADVRDFVPPGSLVEERDSRKAPIWNDVIAACRKPTVARIHGHCLGGGLELALACDIRLAADDAIFGFPEVLLGIIPGAGGTQRLPRIVGIAEALRLILSGERIGAEEALRIGLVTAVVPRADLDAAAQEWAERFSRGAPRAMEFAKESIRRGVEMELSDGLRLETDLATLLTSTSDRVEGMASFAERRPPRFEGR